MKGCRRDCKAARHDFPVDCVQCLVESLKKHDFDLRSLKKGFGERLHVVFSMPLACKH